ncbi:hypothetical protein MED01_003785 [Micromonospora sp. MED01]|uniref:hypothetical protein n=1 Tax=Micromonospora alfalfae TaxID=2911212 RepID=UPI001EE8625B|nr:hypothetical protein [Micromonospora alfalfae]MCG5465501.1 hypothetical protein [Micromonospora alfalfae]
MPMPALPACVCPPAITDASGLLLWMALPARCDRVTAQHLLDETGWAPGHCLDIQMCQGMLVITSAQDDRYRVGSRGELPLPASARQMCRIEPGQPVLLAAFITHDLLVVHPVSTVARRLSNLYCQLAGGDNDR